MRSTRPTNAYDNIFLANYGIININDALTRVPGVASVTVFGAGQYAMRCWVNPDKLASLGVTVPEITNAIQTQNTVNPAGQIGSEPVPHGTGVYLYSPRARDVCPPQKNSARSSFGLNRMEAFSA